MGIGPSAKTWLSASRQIDSASLRQASSAAFDVVVTAGGGGGLDSCRRRQSHVERDYAAHDRGKARQHSSRLVKNLVMRSMKRSTPLRSMRQRFAVRPYSSCGGNGSREPAVVRACLRGACPLVAGSVELRHAHGAGQRPAFPAQAPPRRRRSAARAEALSAPARRILKLKSSFTYSSIARPRRSRRPPKRPQPPLRRLQGPDPRATRETRLGR